MNIPHCYCCTAEGEKSSTVGTFVSIAGLPWVCYLCYDCSYRNVSLV